MPPPPSHPGGVNLFERQFWTPVGFGDVGQQAVLYNLKFWGHKGAPTLTDL